MSLKLNLGCNTRIREGYINIDRDSYPGVNIVADVFSLPMYEDGSVDEAYASNILEHISHTKTVTVLKEWRRILKDGGILKISVPDFDRAIEIYRTHGLKPWVVNFLYGDQGYEGADHRVCFNEEYLTRVLKEAGFTDISRVERLPGCQENECSNNVSTVDGRLVSLNMVACK